MKIIHLSDLHLGKRVNGFSMLEDQRDILHKIEGVIDAEQPQAVVIAGDVYDKSVPSTEAVELFDDFLVSLAQRKLQVFVISGNHDSPERIAFGSRIMDAGGIHMSPVYTGKVAPISLEDSHGPVHFYMLPFIQPAHVRSFYPEETVKSYNEALRVALGHIEPCPEERNVLITHQFVTGSTRCESETISVGGTDNVDADVFSSFDYVALGHIHRPQNCGNNKIRYCGTPLKYSFSEAEDKKSVTVVELEEKGNLQVREVPLTPLREMRILRGTYAELTDPQFYRRDSLQEDYVRIVLTDEENIPHAGMLLQEIYRGYMELRYDNQRTRGSQEIQTADNLDQLSPLDLLAQLYELQNNQPMNEEQRQFMQELTENMKGEQE